MSVGGLSPPVTLAPSSLNFNCYATGCPPRAMLVINTGTTTRHISSITVSAPGYNYHPVFTETNNCGAILGPGQSCAGTVSLATGNLYVHYMGSVNVAYDAAGSPQMVTLTGYFHQ